MRTAQWYEDKAHAALTAWIARYHSVPSKHAIVMVCAVALHETECGDAWNHSGNYGAVQRRSMSGAEKALVQSGAAPPPIDAFEELHGDSSPIHGRYQTWFWKFPQGVIYPPSGLSGDEAGAWMLLGVLLEQHHAIKPIVDTIDAQTLALLMYRSGYYEGVHDPRVGEKGPDGLTDGQRANVADYSHALAGAVGALSVGLRDWWPDSSGYPSEPGTPPDLFTALGVQRALNLLHVADPPLVEDGISGPKTLAAIKRFQAAHDLTVDGALSGSTIVALRTALA